MSFSWWRHNAVLRSWITACWQTDRYFHEKPLTSRTDAVPIKPESRKTNSLYFSNILAIMNAVFKRNKPCSIVEYRCFSEQSKALNTNSRKTKGNQAHAKGLMVMFPLVPTLNRWAFPRFLVQTVKWCRAPLTFLASNDDKPFSHFYCLIILCLFTCKVFPRWMALPVQTDPLLLYWLSTGRTTHLVSTAVCRMCAPSIKFDHSSVAVILCPVLLRGRLWPPLLLGHKPAPVLPQLLASPLNA